jgi:hypothetical protein
MKYGIAYRIKFKNAERNADQTLNNQVVTVMIYDRSLLIDDSDTVSITDLTASSDSLHISTVDNSEDKFTPIKALQATIAFNSDATHSLSTFADAPIPTGGTDPGDPRWEVKISISDRVIFTGFLNIDDCSSPFMPAPEVVVLTANDGLGTLKNKPLTDFSDITPRNYNKIIDYLSWCLSKTGQNLNINCLFNIREANNKGKHFFESCYLWAKTFEEEIGTCEDCYSVIEKILGEEAFLTQRNGEWWIIRIDDLGDENTRYITTFDSKGVLVNEWTSDHAKTIQRGTEIYFSQESTDVATKRPHEFVKETYPFEYPREIVDNIDFSRDDETPYFTENFTEDGVAKIRKRYKITDWAWKRNRDLTIGIDSAYIERIFQGEYEKERYIVVPNTDTYSLYSNAVPINEGDKFTFSIDSKFTVDLSGTKYYGCEIARIALAGDDGSYWTLVDGVTFSNSTVTEGRPYWASVSGLFFGGSIYKTGFLEDNQTEWGGTSVEAPPCPVSGELYIRLQAGLISGQTFDTYFQNLNFDYQPLVNGSYAKYSALYHKVSRDIKYTSVRDEDVKISDGIKKLFKGALFTANYFGLFTATAQFIELAEGYYIVFTGNYQSSLTSTQTIRVNGSTLNDGSYNILEVQYNGTYTTIKVNTRVVAETISVNVDRVRFALTDQFYNYQVYPASVPTDAVHRYAHIQAFDVWNQHRNTLRKFDFTAQGLTSGAVDGQGMADLPHLMYRYTLGDTSNHTTNRFFMLLNFDWDLRLCEWTGSFIEVYKTDVGKYYDDTDNLEIKYVQ